MSLDVTEFDSNNRIFAPTPSSRRIFGVSPRWKKWCIADICFPRVHVTLPMIYDS